jgi:hypothetical protein
VRLIDEKESGAGAQIRGKSSEISREGIIRLASKLSHGNRALFTNTHGHGISGQRHGLLIVGLQDATVLETIQMRQVQCEQRPVCLGEGRAPLGALFRARESRPAYSALPRPHGAARAQASVRLLFSVDDETIEQGRRAGGRGD